MAEKTLVIVKPDGVARGLIGDVIKRFERTGLKIVAAKMMQVTQEHAEKHYPKDRAELWRGIGHKTLDNYKEMGVDAKELLGTDDPEKIGEMVREWLHVYLTEGPVFAMIIEGPHAVEIVRQIAGNTLPLKSAPGTIRAAPAHAAPAPGRARTAVELEGAPPWRRRPVRDPADRPGSATSTLLRPQ